MTRLARLGVVAALVAVGALSVGSVGVATAATVYRAVVEGPISPATSDYIQAALDEASEEQAAALVIELDTPGGLLNSTKTIVKALLASRVPVIVYVAPSGASAASAGVFVTLAGNVAAMAPGTTIGAAHPVSGGGSDIEGDMRTKVENFAVSFVESIAERRGRNVEWAAKAVRESVAITETEALELGVIDIVAANVDDLLVQADGREIEVEGAKRTLSLLGPAPDNAAPTVVDVPMTLRQRVLSVITDPNIAYLLMMAGMLGLYMEFSNPGVIFPGVVGAICLLLALLAGQVLPISSTGVLLIVLGMAFLLAELFMPSFGVLGFGGLLALTLGSLFLYTPESELAVDRSLVTVTIALFGCVLAVILLLLVKDRRRPATTGAEGLVGELGRTLGPVERTGKVRVHGEFWNAHSDVLIEANRPVRVVAVEGLTLRVREEQE